MLIDFQDWEDQSQHVVNEVVQQMLITFVNLDEGLVCRCVRTVREVKEVEI